MEGAMRRIIVCGPPHSGKSVFLANLMRQLPPDSFYLAFAAPDGEWHWSNFGDQDLVAVVRQKGKFTDNFVSSMVEAIRANEQPLVLVDTGGVRSEANERIFAVSDGCIILSSKPEEIVAWREFAAAHGVAVLAELDSVLHGTCELYPPQDDGVIRGRIAGLERGHTVVSPTLEAVAERLRTIIRSNAEMSEGEVVANVNGATLVSRLGVVDQNDPFLGVRPEHLVPALRLTAAVAKLPVVRVWNVRAAILASAYAARIPGSVELYDVSKGYISIPEVTPQGDGFCPGVMWEVLPLPEFTVVKWRNTRFITADDLRQLVPPSVTTKPVVVVNDGPPMWLHATLVRAYARAGCPWVGQFWPVESGRAQPSLSGKRWDEAYPFAGPAVVVAGPEEKVGEMFPISFDLLRWGTPVMGRLGSGEIVVDAANSHVATHPTVHAHLAETLSRIHASGRERFCESVDFGRVIGETICVETSGSDDIVFAQRPRRKGLTRFVKNRRPEPTTQVTACVQRLSGGAYLLLTAFVGPRAPAEPWDTKFADEASREFWSTHALVWGCEETIPGTETNECPW
jgi:CRISPR-associated protein Csx3